MLKLCVDRVEQHLLHVCFPFFIVIINPLAATLTLIILQLAAVLREVKYLEKRHSEEIPETAAKLYERHQEFWSYLNSLDVTVKWYNHVRQTTLEVCGCYIVACMRHNRVFKTN